jgi:Reverse transcriptase (RNA-dependent DNA polymerase)
MPRKNVSKNSKGWWTDVCSCNLAMFQASCLDKDWKWYCCTMRMAKQKFFNECIHEVASLDQWPWDLTAWVHEHNLPSHEAISYWGVPCMGLDHLWTMLDGSYDAASGWQVDLSFLDPLSPEPIHAWVPFSLLEFMEALLACAKCSAPGPDHVTWFLKCWCQAPGVSELFVHIAEACIWLGHWPSHFKESLSVIILKPGKPDYSTPKSFQPIVLLNTLGKLFKKLLACRLKFDGVAHGTFHPMQFGGIAQRSTEDAGFYLTHLVQAGWAEGLQTSVVTFDIAQFFPSINHEILLWIIDRSGFPTCVERYFWSYLVGRCTIYKWNTFTSGSYLANKGVGQGSAMSPVLSSLCLVPILKLYSASDSGCQVNIMSYVDDGTLIAHSPQLEDNLKPLKEAHGWIYHPFTSLSLVLEHTRSEAFHFTRARGDLDLPINLSFQPIMSNTPLRPKLTWQYFGFFFDHKLLFKEHIWFYSTKAQTTIRAMGTLGNSM